MQLMIRRSQRDGGIIFNKVIFCLYARVGLTGEEQHQVTRYRLHNQIIYNSEASARFLARADAQDGSLKGNLKSLLWVAMARMRLNISIASLQRGQHVECKSLDELLGAEEAIMAACENLRLYLDTAAAFDGREILFEFATGGTNVIAHAGVGAPALAMAQRKRLAAPADELSTQSPGNDDVLAVSWQAPSYVSQGNPVFDFWAGLSEQQRLGFACAALVILIAIFTI